MPDSKREIIIANLVTALQGITIAGGYDLDIQAVHRIGTDAIEQNAYPFIVVAEVSEEKRQGPPLNKYECRLRLVLDCWVEIRTTLGQEVNKILANVEKAVMVDTKRGGDAIDTRITGNRSFMDQTTEPRGGVEIDVEILYRHALTSPFSG